MMITGWEREAHDHPVTTYQRRRTRVVIKYTERACVRVARDSYACSTADARKNAVRISKTQQHNSTVSRILLLACYRTVGLIKRDILRAIIGSVRLSLEGASTRLEDWEFLNTPLFWISR